jgi:predicted CoA-binding protein
MPRTTTEAVEAAIRRPRWAVVGASDKPDRISHRIVMLLVERGFEVLPIHPKLEAIGDLRCWPSLAALPEPADVVNMIVNPTHGAEVVEHGIGWETTQWWFQPGSESDELFDRLEAAGREVIEACALVVLGARPGHRFPLA